MDSNPLKQYFRQPAIFITLPSQGEFYPPGALEVTANGEYPVLPMTTLDEVTYRTPDALFNGQAVTSVIESCMPNIKDAWNMPSSDLDTVLIAIRIATYGHELEVNTECPECKTEADYLVDLRRVLGQIKKPNYASTLEIGDLKIHFRPMSYKNLNENSMEQFEEQKTIQVMQDANLTEAQKMQQLGDMLKKITTVTTRALAENIGMVQAPHSQVTEQAHIVEWLSNCDRAMFARIRDHIVSIKQQSEIPPLKIKCASCQHEYEQMFTLDMSNFFAAAS